MGKYVEFSEEQLQIANNIDIADFLRKQGEQLEKSGREYRWLRNSSVTIRGNRWFQHKYQEGGYPIQFLRKFFHYSFPEAVEVLLDDNGTKYSQYDKGNVQRKEFIIPKKNITMKRVYAYLIKQRYIDANVLKEFTQRELIYESEKYHNIVFAGYDEDGVMKHAHKKSTFTKGKGYRGNETGSDPKYSFHWKGTSNRIYVFEAPIDMLSYISLHLENWQQHSYVALNGVSIQPLLHQLETNEILNEIYLCLDHDIAGSEATSRIIDELNKKYYENIKVEVSTYKDWNEDLKQKHGEIPIPAEENIKIRFMHQLIKDHEKDLLVYSEKIEIKDIMDSYMNIFPILNQKEVNIENLKKQLLNLCRNSMQMRSRLFDEQRNLVEDLKTGFLSFKDRGDLSKRIEQLKENIYELKQDYISSSENTLLKLKNDYLDVAEASIQLVSYLDIQQIAKEKINMNQNKKPKCPMIDNDGNIFAIIGLARKSLDAVNREEQGIEMQNRIFECGSYEEALEIVQEYVQPISLYDFSERIYAELSSLQSDLKDIQSDEKIQQISEDIMMSEETEEALSKIKSYRDELLCTLSLNYQ